MIVKRVLLNNVGPFLFKWEVELGEGMIAVVAEYEGAPARSNRAGKSWFAVDALRYALHGTFRGRADDVVHRRVAGSEEGFVELEVVSSAGETFVIRRGRRGSSPIRVLNGAGISERDLERVVREEVLGLSADEYLATNAFVQGEMHSFMSMSAAEKRRLVSPWFSTDRWVPRAELARVRLRRAQSALRDADQRAEALRDKLGASEGVEVTLVRERANLKAAQDAAAEAHAARSAARDAVEAVSAARAEREELRREVSRLALARDEERARVEEIAAQTAARAKDAEVALDLALSQQNRLAELEERLKSLDELRSIVSETERLLREAERDRSEATEERECLLRRFKEVSRSRTGVCPVLREPCTRIDPDEVELNLVRREGLRQRRRADRADRAISDLDWKLSNARLDVRSALEEERELIELRRRPSVAQCRETFETRKALAEDAKARLSAVKLARTETAKAHVRAIKAFDAAGEVAEDVDARRRYEEAEAALADAARHLERTVDAHAEAVAAVRAEEDAREELARLEAERPALREDVERLAWAAYAFGASGIPSRELENAFGVAEDEMNAVLSDLSSTLRLRFSPTRELKDWEPACLACGEPFPKGARRRECAHCGTPRRKRRRDELRLEVLDGAVESTFELDSGGGKILLSVGARLGLAAIPGRSRAVRCEHLLLDEPDGALDEPNRRALYALLRDRLGALGIRQGILVTHTDVREEFDDVVTVRRFEDEDRSAVWKD